MKNWKATNASLCRNHRLPLGQNASLGLRGHLLEDGLQHIELHVDVDVKPLFRTLLVADPHGLTAEVPRLESANVRLTEDEPRRHLNNCQIEVLHDKGLLGLGRLSVDDADVHRVCPGLAGRANEHNGVDRLEGITNLEGLRLHRHTENLVEYRIALLQLLENVREVPTKSGLVARSVQGHHGVVAGDAGSDVGTELVWCRRGNLHIRRLGGGRTHGFGEIGR